MESTLVNIKNRITIWSSSSTSGYIPRRIENKDLNRYLDSLVYSSIIHSNQEVEATQMSVNGWISQSVQSFSHVRLFAASWTAARQASLSITNSQSLLKLMSIESVMPSIHLILCHLLLLLPSIGHVAMLNMSQRVRCDLVTKQTTRMNVVYCSRCSEHLHTCWRWLNSFPPSFYNEIKKSILELPKGILGRFTNESSSRW